ncbi:GtrA family protein [Nocardia sp. BMG111209]|uniref:GtrA family protein n=1 Tax=Nocardia sp. BMG111209 TaxID=1160137 RepID=UPI0003698E95
MSPQPDPGAPSGSAEAPTITDRLVAAADSTADRLAAAADSTVDRLTAAADSTADRLAAVADSTVDRLAAVADSTAEATPRLLTRLGAWLRSEHWLPQLIRFALVGGFSNIGYFLLFLACYAEGPQLANLTGSVVSTALANELHRRLTFHASDRVGWFTAQLEGGGLALAGLAISSAALAGLDYVAPGLGDAAEAAAVIAITAAVGTLRFITLRFWVF